MTCSLSGPISSADSDPSPAFTVEVIAYPKVTRSELESGAILAYAEETAAALHVPVVSPKKRAAG
jgi:hypothetical protein